MTGWITLGVIIVPAVLLLFGGWSAWRDPDNWVLDGAQNKIRFKNWTELSAYAAILSVIGVCAVLFIA